MIKDRKQAKDSGWKLSDGYRRYGAVVIAERINKMVSFARDVRRGTDIEAVHDMRVASRRLRAALAVFEPAFHGQAYERLGREVKLVTDSLSRARDLDVMVRDLGADAVRLPITQRGAVLDLVRQWAAERRRIQGDVVAALDRLAERDPVRMFDEIAHVTGPDGSAANAGPALGSPRPGGAA